MTDNHKLKLWLGSLPASKYDLFIREMFANVNEVENSLLCWIIDGYPIPLLAKCTIEQVSENLGCRISFGNVHVDIFRGIVRQIHRFVETTKPAMDTISRAKYAEPIVMFQLFAYNELMNDVKAYEKRG